MTNFISAISNKKFPNEDKVSGKTIRTTLFSFIQQQHPTFTTSDFLSTQELNSFREAYITQYISEQIGVLGHLEHKVIFSLTDDSTVTSKLEEDDSQSRTNGQRIADKVASFGGSWSFIIFFGVFILVWISINVFWLYRGAFDPYPFILLNLILSCIAALQAPIIMMSQNRQEEKDRERSKKDYMINLKSEIEIRTLHEKIDHLIMHQQQELLELQRIQIEMMNDILSKVNK